MSSHPPAAPPASLESIAPWLTRKLRGRVLLVGPTPLSFLRAVLAQAENVCLFGPDPVQLGVMRRVLVELGGEPVAAVVGRPSAPPFRREPSFDHAFVSCPDDGVGGAARALAAIASHVAEGPPIALTRTGSAAELGPAQGLAIVAASAPFYLVEPIPNGPALRPERSVSPLRPPAEPAVAVIVTTRDRAPLLERAVESVLALDRTPTEVVVVDDASQDATPQLLTRWAGRVVHLRHEDPTGQARAMNDGIAATRAEWIAWLDDDDYFLPAKLRLGLRAAGRDPEVGLVVTAHYLGDAGGNPTAMRLLPEFAPGEILRLLLRGSVFLGPTALVRRSAYAAIGPRPYDETLARAADYRMWWEIARRFRVAAVQVPLTVVCRHPGNELDRPLAERIYGSVRATLAWVRAAIPLAELAGGDREGRATDLGRVELERASALLRVGLFALAEPDLAPLARAGIERAQNLLGLAALEQGAYPAAAERFAEALRDHPGNHAAVHGLATARLLLGERSAAERILAAALARAPEDELARYHLALCAESDPTRPGPALARARDLLARHLVRSALYSPSPPVRGLDRHFTAIRRRSAEPDD